MAREKKQADAPAGCPAWLATYGDMVTLVLTFFVLLFSMSSIDAAKWKTLVTVFSGGSGVLTEQAVAIPSMEGTPVDTVPNSSQEINEEFEQLYEDIKTDVSGEGANHNIDVENNGYEILIRFPDNVFFDLGSAALKPESLSLLDAVIETVLSHTEAVSMVRIEGHTDTAPIHTAQYPSNWELASMRATNVLRYAVEQKGFDSKKVSSVGYGEMHPIAPNDTRENMAKNRRVDFVIARGFGR